MAQSWLAGIYCYLSKFLNCNRDHVTYNLLHGEDQEYFLGSFVWWEDLCIEIQTLQMQTDAWYDVIEQGSADLCTRRGKLRQAVEVGQPRLCLGSEYKRQQVACKGFMAGAHCQPAWDLSLTITWTNSHTERRDMKRMDEGDNEIDSHFYCPWSSGLRTTSPN